MPLITERHFYQYLSCPRWTYREREELPTLKLFERRLVLDGLLPEMNRALMADRGYDEVDEEDHEEAGARTLELMAHGVPRILHGALVHGRFVSRPDVLERVEGRSRFGSYYYVACDIKRSRKLSREARMTGVFHAEVLGLVQGARPTQGYVMDPDGVVQSFFIEEFEGEYHLALHRLERVLSGEDPGEFLTSLCKRAPSFDLCKEEATACDHLSRLNRIWEEEVYALESAGYDTVSMFARAKPSILNMRVKGIRPERLLFLHRQARALISGTHDVVTPVSLPSAPVELYFDIEADPLRDLDYLFGVLEVHRGADGRDEKTYHAFLAKSPSEERAAWEAFVAFATEHAPAPIFYYGRYEVEVVRRMGQKYGTDPAVLEALLLRLSDLLAPIRSSVIFPLTFYSLKDLAAYTGFSWRNPEASGAGSILWYEDWLAFGDEAKLKAILEYNEDDVRATHALKRWLETHASA